MSKKGGYIYILSNPSMPGVLKIGKTTRDPEVRVKELNSATGVPMPFKIEGIVKTTNLGSVEREIHRAVQGRRVNERREFFRLSVKDAKAIAIKVAKKSNSTFLKGKDGSFHTCLSPVVFSLTIFSWAYMFSGLLASGWLLLSGFAYLLGHPRTIAETMYLPTAFGKFSLWAFVVVGVLPVVCWFDLLRLLKIGEDVGYIVYNLIHIYVM